MSDERKTYLLFVKRTVHHSEKWILVVIGVESVDVHWYTYVMLLNERLKRFEEKEERG